MKPCLRCQAPMRRKGCTCCGAPLSDCTKCIPMEPRDGALVVVPVRCAGCKQRRCRYGKRRCFSAANSPPQGRVS